MKHRNEEHEICKSDDKRAQLTRDLTGLISFTQYSLIFIFLSSSQRPKQFWHCLCNNDTVFYDSLVKGNSEQLYLHQMKSLFFRFTEIRHLLLKNHSPINLRLSSLVKV